MGVLLQDVEEELCARITHLQPLLAPRLALRLSRLPASEVATMLSSEASLARYVDWAVSQEVSESATAAPPMVTTVPCNLSSLIYSVPTTVLPAVPCPPSILVGEGDDTTAAVLTSRVAQLEPELAGRIVEKILALGSSVINECVASDSSLQQRVGAAMGAIRREDSCQPETSCAADLSQSARVVDLPQQPLHTVEQPALPAVSHSAFPTVSALPLAVDAPTAIVRQVEPVPVVEPAVCIMQDISPSLRTTDYVVGDAVSSRKAPARIWGLEDFLAQLGLTQYFLQATEWAANMGAVFLEELLEHQEDFADALNLRPLERNRLRCNGPDVAARLADLRPRECIFRQIPLVLPRVLA